MEAKKKEKENENKRRKVEGRRDRTKKRLRFTSKLLIGRSVRDVVRSKFRNVPSMREFQTSPIKSFSNELKSSVPSEQLDPALRLKLN